MRRPRSGNHFFSVFDDIPLLYKQSSFKEQDDNDDVFDIELELLSLEIIGTINKQFHKKEFTTYNIQVSCKYFTPHHSIIKTHIVNRRFNEFKVLHLLLNDSNLELPTSLFSFNKLANDLIQFRSNKLQEYLSQLLYYYKTNRIVLHFLEIEYLNPLAINSLKWKFDLEMQSLQMNELIGEDESFYEYHFQKCDQIRLEMEEFRISRDVEFDVFFQNKPCILQVLHKECRIVVNQKEFFIFEMQGMTRVQHSFSKIGKEKECFEAISIQFPTQNIWLFCRERQELMDCLHALGKRWSKNCQQLQHYIHNYLLPFKHTAYDATNFLHENLLLQYWNTIMEESLKERKSDQWSKIGFQGNDPASDFRAFGLLGLKVLLYFAIHYNKQVKQIIRRIQEQEQYYYPFSVSGINVFCILFQLLQTDEKVVRYVNCLYGNCKIENQQKSIIEELFVVLCLYLDRKWQEKQATYMDYPFILQETKRWFLDLVESRKIVTLQELIKQVV